MIDPTPERTSLAHRVADALDGEVTADGDDLLVLCEAGSMRLRFDGGFDVDLEGLSPEESHALSVAWESYWHSLVVRGERPGDPPFTEG